MLATPKNFNGISYFQRGTHPILLILSGTHGDETDITPFVTQYIEKHEDSLPDYLYIPEVSPSAVARKTRRNKYDHDLNRYFRQGSEDPEAQAVMAIVKSYKFSLALMFHEDDERSNEFYTYDSATMTPGELSLYRKAITGTGATLFSGIDDPTDLALGTNVVEGYVPSSPDQLELDSGFFMDWVTQYSIVARSFNPEIPGKGDLQLKQRLVNAFFTFALQFI